MIDVGWVSLVVLAFVIAVGAYVQSVVGLGVGLVGAPVITLLAPELMPGGMLLVAMVLPLMTLAGEHDDVDWRGLGWALPARVVGTAIGVWVVLSVDERGLGIAVGVMVLAAVLLTARTVAVPITPGTLSTAGLISGITGTASSIGGPPFALLYQRHSPRQIRCTLAVYFMAGAVFSVVGLAAVGGLTREEWVFAALMLPALAAGFAVSGPLRQRLPAQVMRPLVLAVSGVSAAALVVRSLIG